MKKFYLFLILFSISIVAAATNWDDEFAAVCKYDNYCSRLKNQDGTWRPLKPEILAIYRTPEMRKEILAAGAKYGVDPAAVASAVATENSLNVTLARHQTQDWLASNLGITKIGSKSFSIGLGEIHVDSAMEAETYIAKLEHRTPRTQDEMIKELNDPLGSIRTAAMIIREAQDIYRDNGFDISKDPGILATVYNLGKPMQRAAEAKQLKRLPRVNYFGLFTEKNLADIRNVAGLTVAAAKIQGPKLPIGKTSTLAPTLSTVKVPMANQLVANSGIPLAMAAPICTDQNDYADEQDPTKVKFAPPSGAINAGETITELGRGLDCDSKIWKLVKSSSGIVGWVGDEALTKSASMQLAPKLKCTDHADAKCSKAIADVVKPFQLDLDGKTRVWLKPYSKSKDISFAQADNECRDEKTAAAEQSTVSSNSQSGANYGNNGTLTSLTTPALPVKSDLDKLSDADLKAKLEASTKLYKQVLSRMAKGTGVKEEDLVLPENSYYTSALILQSALAANKMCAESLSAEKRLCVGVNISADPLVLANLTYSQSPSMQDLLDSQQAIRTLVTPEYMNSADRINYYDPTDDELKAATVPQMRSSLKSCFSRVQSLLESDSKAITDQMATVNQAIVASTVNTLAAGSPNQAQSQAQTQAHTTLIYKLDALKQSKYNLDNTSSTITLMKSTSDQAKDEELNNFKFYVLAATKMCSARLNLLLTEMPDLDLNKNMFACEQSPSMVTLNYGSSQFMKQFLLNNAKDQNLQADVLNDTVNSALYGNLYVLADVINRRVAAAAAAAAQAAAGTTPAANNTYAPPPPPPPPPSTYCPGRTAEFLENLLKSNPCVSHIYVPSRWIVMKLKDYSSKVIYRDFDKKDRYLVEYGDSTCK